MFFLPEYTFLKMRYSQNDETGKTGGRGPRNQNFPCCLTMRSRFKDNFLKIFSMDFASL